MASYQIRTSGKYLSTYSARKRWSKMKKRILIVTLFATIILSASFQGSKKAEPATVCTENVFTQQIEPEFVEIEYIVHNELDLQEEADGKFKTYMDYRKIADKNSKQWKLQQRAW